MLGIANLCSESIRKIKDQGLLTMSFFEVIPNKDDELDEFYQPIFEGLVAEFESNKHNLIPMENGKFGSLDSVIYCSRIVKDAFNQKDDFLYLFTDDLYDGETLLGFAKNPLINSRSHKFLSELYSLQEYDDNEIFNSFFNTVATLSDTNLASVRKRSRDYDDDDDLNLLLQTRECLERKSNDNLQRIYAFLNEVIDQNSGPFSSILSRNSKWDDFKCIIRLKDETFNYGEYDVYFPTSSKSLGSKFRYVHPESYSYGKKKGQQQKARSFLEKIGVQDIDDSTHIGLMFDEYKFVSQTEHLNDINRLVDWYLEEQKSNSNNQEILKKIGIDYKYFVFTDKHKLVCPYRVYIDEPFAASGLRHIESVMYHQRLHKMYQNLNNSSKFIEILTILGSQFS